MRFRYYIPDEGGTVENAREIYCERFAGGSEGWGKHDEFDSHEEAVDNAAKLHYERNASDWNGGKVTIAIVDKKETELFDVELDHVPSFTVSPHKE